MKRAFLLLFVVSIGACASTGAVAVDGPSPATARTPAVRFQTGHALFSARCQSCHALPEPTRLRPEVWPVKVAGMSRKAGLSSEQVALISDYLVAASSSRL